MPQSYFQFKQFTVQQDQAAMKVTTDACLFGAWVAEKVQREGLPVQRALDIGAGTGLLMLQLAQQSTAIIEGIEVDSGAYRQATENCLASPWAERLHLYHGDMREYPLPHTYDLILSNPPFYEQSLLSPDRSRNLALHDAGLRVEELSRVAAEWINPGGHLAVLLPHFRSGKWQETAATAGWFVREWVQVRPREGKPFFRSMCWMGREAVEAVKQEIVIADAAGNYTTDFIRLLQPYYLYL
ncbi:MAG TPA: methyltransferase [Lacibacter sp.]|nr:methyltransferase [Lacibacter sp.]